MKNMSEFTTSDLFKLHHNVLTEPRRQENIRSGSNIVSNYAETLVCKALGLRQVPTSTPGYDATDKNGHRYQIKARMLLSLAGSRQLGALRGLNSASKPFDYLVGVLFDEFHNVIRAALIPIDVVRKRAKFQEHTNSHIFMLKDDVWNDPNVTNVTNEVRAAALDRNPPA